MPKRTIIIFIIAVIALLVVGAVLYFLTMPEETKEKGFLPGIFPSAPGVNEPGAPSEPSQETIKEIITAPSGNLIQLTNQSVSGATFKDGRVRYIERATGHIYEVDPDGRNRVRISNTTIPKVFNVIWSKHKDYAVLRYYDVNEDTGQNIVQNLAVHFTGSTTQGILLPQNIASITTAPKENKILYFVPYNNTNILISADFENKNQKQLFSTAFGEFKISWPDSDFVSLLSKPASFANGFLYKIDIRSGRLTKILGDIPGLNVLWSPDGNKIIYSATQQDKPTLFILDTTTKNDIPLNLQTLVEKCVWSALEQNVVYCAEPANIPSGKYPESWYQGEVSFNDVLLKKDFSTGEVKIFNLEGYQFDIINLFLDEDEQYLFFTNKKDGSLWSLQLTNGI